MELSGKALGEYTKGALSFILSTKNKKKKNKRERIHWGMEWTGHVLFWEPPDSPSSQSWIYHIFLQRGGLKTQDGLSETSPSQATAIDSGMERRLSWLLTES